MPSPQRGPAQSSSTAQERPASFIRVSYTLSVQSKSEIVAAHLHESDLPVGHERDALDALVRQHLHEARVRQALAAHRRQHVAVVYSVPQLLCLQICAIWIRARAC